jgi:hypothetical protein
MELIQSAIVGVVTGLFSAGAVWGVLKTELRWLRRDVDWLLQRTDGAA